MKLIQAKEAAELTGLTRQTIQNWMKKGAIKVHKVGKALFVDADTLIKLADTVADVNASKEALLKEKEAYERERIEYKEMRQGVRDKVWRVRYLYLMTNSAIKTDFYKKMVRLFCMYCDLNPREGQVLTMLLEGTSCNEIAKKLGITDARVQQITSKAIRMSNNLTTIQEKLDSIDIKDAYIEELKGRTEELREQLLQIENTKKMREQMEADDYITSRMAEDDTLRLYKTKLTDLHVSVRALNCVNQLGIETVGELASRQKSDLLKARNCGSKTLYELECLLERCGLEFGSNIQECYETKKQEFLDEWKRMRKVE